MATALALIAGGALIVLIGVYFWNHPEQYYKYLNSTSVWAGFNARPPEPLVKVGAALSVITGIAVIVWGLGSLIS
jgi:hypothetical protein